MDKYIKESDLFKRILNVDFKHDYDGCIKFCQSIPAADVEEVVRCKDCKHADLFYPYCTIWEAAIDGDGYCYKGEKE